LRDLCSVAYPGRWAMWIVEVNVLGRRFTHEVRDRREAFKFSPRNIQARLSDMRNPRAAA
jgi:hypothetical protein